MRWRTCGIVAGLLAAWIAIGTSVLASDNQLDLILEKHHAEKTFTSEYIQLTDELFDIVSQYKTNDNDEYKTTAQNTGSYLDAAIARVDFLMEDTIRRLGSSLEVNVDNADYVASTMGDIAMVYTMPSMKQQSPANSAAYAALLDRLSRIEKFGESVKLVEKQMEDQPVDQAIVNYYKLGNERDLVAKAAVQSLANRIVEAKKTDITLPPEVKSAPGIALFERDGKIPGKINVEYTKNTATLPVKFQTQMLYNGHCKAGFKLTVNGVGGSIPITSFTMPIVATDVPQYIIHSSGRVFPDIDNDPATITFDSNTLGDFYLFEYQNLTQYTSDYDSKLEWQYQEAVVSKALCLALTLERSSVNISVNTVGIKTLPYSALAQLADTNKIVELITEDKTVKLLPKAFAALAKEELMSMSMLIPYAEATQNDEKYAGDYTNNDIPVDTQPDKDTAIDTGVGRRAILRALSVAGIVLAAVAIAILCAYSQKAQKKEEDTTDE